ncbi:MAG: cation-transporting P-type ATPase, partial [Thermoleophilia bacterium]|nr:cation-transporting P-type ATPase [Thermoleophilia bacterium]
MSSDLPEPANSQSFARSVSGVLTDLDVRPGIGLSEDEVALRRARHGPNRLPEQRPKSAWGILLDQFKSLIFGLLLGALALSAITTDWLEAVAIAVVILLSAAIGFVSEIRAVRSMEALRRLGEASATVRRDSVVRHIAADELVPGDIVVMDAGDVVTADLRIIGASRLQADEATLTGESTPVDKSAEPVDSASVLADRTSMLFKGTAVTRGSAEAVVCGTGMATELGRITALVESSSDARLTPLERRLNRLGGRLVWLTLGIAVLVAVAGIDSGED